MKQIKWLGFLGLAIFPMLGFATDHGGYYCSRVDGAGQTTLSFVVTDQSTSRGVLIFKQPGRSPLIDLDAAKYWSGSMFISSGQVMVVQGPGNGMNGILLVQPMRVGFDLNQCEPL